MGQELKNDSWNAPPAPGPDAVARLAAGVAHDLNNLLTPILGYSEILLETLEPGKRPHVQAEEIHRAAERSREIVSRLLSYSVREAPRRRPMNAQDVALGLQGSIRAIVRPDITLHVSCGRQDASVDVDPVQIEQAMMILVANAQDAMPQGGTLFIEARRATEEEEETLTRATGRDFRGAGLLRLTDTGTGMTEEAQKHLFEPFYATKANGSLGFGMATAWNIVRHHEGTILVDSRPGQGTAVGIFLPGSAMRREEKPLPASHVKPETVLVVEDMEMVRVLTCHLLEEAGYSALPAASAEEAVRILEERPGRTRLMLTDALLPGISGPLLFENVKKRFPDLRVLFMSGYSLDDLARDGRAPVGACFIQKPFSAADLAKKVREALDS